MCIDAKLDSMLDIGPVPGTYCRVIPIAAHTFEGEHLRGKAPAWGA